MQALDRMPISDSWVTLVFFVAILILVLLKRVDHSKLAGYASAFFTKGFVQEKTLERESFFSFFSLLLFVFSGITYAILIDLVAPLFFSTPEGFLFFCLLFSVISVYVFFLLLIDYGVLSLFKAQKEAQYFLTAKMSYFYSTALLLFPILIITHYSFLNAYVSFFSWMFFFLFSLTLICVNNKNLIVSKLFYFILYICTLKLAPLLIIYKITV